MKRLFATILTAALLLSLCACTTAPAATTGVQATEPTPAESQTTAPTPSETQSTAPETQPTEPATQPTEPETQPTEPAPTEPLAPTQEELDAMWEYAHIISTLNSYVANGYIYYSIYDENGEIVQTLRDQEALDYCYQQLASMECIDRWIGTEFTEGINWRDEVPVWDRVGALNGFTVLRDLKLRQDFVIVKQDGTTESGTESAWEYDTTGRLVSIDGVRNMFEVVQTVPSFPGNFTVYFSFHDDGTYSQILYGSNAYATAIPTYDADGNIVSLAITSRDDSTVVTYTYSGGLVTKISWEEYGYPFDIEYTYDENGNVIRSVYTEYTDTDQLKNNIHIHHRLIFDYVYSGDQLVSATCLEENWSWEWDENFNYVFFVELRTTDTYSFAYDDQGRLSDIDITYGNSIWAHGDKEGTLCREPEYKSKHIDLIYGNYYFYG